jgi:ribosomal protein L21E
LCLSGKVTGNQGKAYVVSTRVGKMLKELIVRPEHLRKAK